MRRELEHLRKIRFDVEINKRELLSRADINLTMNAAASSETNDNAYVVAKRQEIADLFDELKLEKERGAKLRDRA